MRHALAMLFVTTALAVTPFTARLAAQECTGPECATPGGHQCEREKNETPTA
ncbi:MAG: hypothetical protein KDJ43_09920 [Rhizobiaceae bacterium]|nr:hypothetical protein [Rhizobiaceae bacterium]